jgi:hypothetical protein
MVSTTGATGVDPECELATGESGLGSSSRLLFLPVVEELACGWAGEPGIWNGLEFTGLSNSPDCFHPIHLSTQGDRLR